MAIHSCSLRFAVIIAAVIASSHLEAEPSNCYQVLWPPSALTECQKKLNGKWSSGSVDILLPVKLVSLDNNEGEISQQIQLQMSPTDVTALLGVGELSKALHLLVYVPDGHKQPLVIDNSSLLIITPFLSKDPQVAIHESLTGVLNGSIQNKILDNLEKSEIAKSRWQNIVNSYCSLIVQRALRCAQIVKLNVDDEVRQLKSQPNSQQLPGVYHLCVSYLSSSRDSKSSPEAEISYLLEALRSDGIAGADIGKIEMDIRVKLSVIGRIGNFSDSFIALLSEKDNLVFLIELLRAARNAPNKSDLKVYLAALNMPNADLNYQAMSLLHAFVKPYGPPVPKTSTFKSDPDKYIDQWRLFISNSYLSKH